MGWDDSDEEEWDDDALEAKLEQQLKEKERAKRREQGLDSESEEEESKPAAPAPKTTNPKPKAKVQAAPKVEEPELTAEERKLRQRRIEEENNDRLARDMMGGEFQSGPSLAEERKRKEAEEAERRRKAAEVAKAKIKVIDAFDEVKLHKQADVEKLCKTCTDKITQGVLRGGSNFFLKTMLKSFEDKISLEDMGEIDKLLQTVAAEKKAAQGAVAAKDNKANTKCSKTTKFNTAHEWEDVYGGGEDDEDWTQEEWDEWNRQQAAA